MKTTILRVALVIAVGICCILAIKLRTVENRLPTPVKVLYRKALTGDGYVVEFHNQTRKSLNVGVDLSNDRRSKHYQFVLDTTKEIGYLQGWAAASGDNITVACSGYDTFSKHIP